MRELLTGDSEAVSSVIGIILMVAVAVIIAATLAVFGLQFGQENTDVAPTAQFGFESNYFGDGVQKNDSVVIVHQSGDELERDRIEVRIGGNVVYNETENSESDGGKAVPGLVLEVDEDNFNDLNKPCRFKPKDCTDSDPPGDSDGADPGVVFEWEENVTAGQRLTIQERNAGKAMDVIQAGDRIEIIYRGEDYTAIIAVGTVAPEHAD